MAKKKILSEKEVALQELIEAREEVKRAEQMFNFAIEEYFEIANMELTIAQMRYKLVVSKLKKLCGQESENPQQGLFFASSW